MGLWYEPALDGSGFDIALTPSGLVVYYYGWDNDGNRLWLMSDLGPMTISQGSEITLSMRMTNGGNYQAPALPSTLTQWGSLHINFTGCTNATATLTGNDGSSVVMNNLQLLAGVLGMPPC
jgi:hypothetical protein